MEDNNKALESLIQIASELQRLEKVFYKAIGKLDLDEQNKYASQFSWFTKRVTKALDQVGLTRVSLEKEVYDPGMAVTPLNLDDFETDDILIVDQMIEPIIMQGNNVVKTGTVILRRAQ